jgi:hypothetical protein
LKDLVLGQAKINESLNRKLAANDKTLESLNIKIQTLSSALKNQLSFNKMIETQLTQVAATIPISEKVSVVTMRGGKSTRDPPYPNHAGKPTHQRLNTWDVLVASRQEDLGFPMISCSIYNCYFE